MGDAFLYVANVIIKKSILFKDKTYKINYRYDLLRFSKKRNKIKVVSESHVTGNDKFTRLLEFKKHGFHFDSKLSSLGMETYSTHITNFSQLVVHVILICIITIQYLANLILYLPYIHIVVNSYIRWITKRIILLTYKYREYNGRFY